MIRKKFLFNYTLTPEWLKTISNDIGAELIDGKILRMPKQLAEGAGIFLEVLPGLSVFLIDMYFHEPVTITRVPKDDLYFAYYDLGEKITTHLLNGTPHRAGYYSKLGMAFMDSSIPTSLLPPVGARSYSLRLLISKKLLPNLTAINQHANVDFPVSEQSIDTLYYYSHIDSRSRILLNRLKSKDINDVSFEFHLKHTALYLLAYLVERATNAPIINKLPKQEVESIMASANYLTEQLLSDFPTIETLARTAGMSVSKYKSLFKKLLHFSPKQFFINEKLLLGKELLESGNFSHVSEVAYELGYSKPSYFAEVYKNKFGINPNSLLVRNK
nr:AraC family transcriptional regulator [Sphingobacterium sp. lm-10]